jgi:hypothetical protein
MKSKYIVQVFRNNEWQRYSSHCNLDYAEANASQQNKKYPIRIIYLGKIIDQADKKEI